MAKAPRPRKPEDDGVKDSITIVVDGVRYPLKFRELSAKDAADLRRATGLSLRGVMAAHATDPDIDVIAALVWMSRRQNGAPNIPYDAVAKEITYASDYGEAPGDDSSEEDEHDPQH